MADRQTRFELVVGEVRLVFEGSETYVVEQLAAKSADIGRILKGAAELHRGRGIIPSGEEPEERQAE